jgi:leucyl-tRNA synthetase
VAEGEYDPHSFEEGWVETWAREGLYTTPNEVPSGQKRFVAEMFPYPSGDLHIGHVENYSIADVMARYSRMRGMSVLHPMGFDAFGLPAENAAISRGVHPREWTYSNIQQMRSSLERLGFSFDWSRQVVTCEPEYYKWNQWFFLQLFERGLAYRKKSFVNWCPVDRTVLAKEQLSTGVCWRCGSVPELRDLSQWYLKITDYSDRLLDDMDLLEWSDSVLARQRAWIGRQRGAEVRFPVRDAGGAAHEAVVFTTRPDTVWGATFLVLAPEHPLARALVAGTESDAALEAALSRARTKGEVGRVSGAGGVDAMQLPGTAVNPVNGEEIPVWIADYVLADYGTGAVMGVPAHDQRDLDFARANGLPVRVVVQPPDGELDGATMTEAYTGPGTMRDSGPLDGTPVDPETHAGVDDVAAWLDQQGFGKPVTTFRQRDWLISRQRYWGTPIPIIHCETCGEVAVPEDQLPVLLPDEMPSMADAGGDAVSPLAAVSEWVNVPCPKCGGPAKRDSDTLDTFFDSSWYFLRYCDPHNDTAMFDPKAVSMWCPVDNYFGGMDHAVMHLIYARFFVKVMMDMGMLDFPEPFLRLINQGWVTFAGKQMSKSSGHNISAADILARYGADAGRVFILFSGPPEADYDFPADGLDLVGRVSFSWLARVWRLLTFVTDEAPSAELESLTHVLIKDITSAVDRFSYNIAIAHFMEFSNRLAKLGAPVPIEVARTFLLLLAPFAPFMTEELWHRYGATGPIHRESWPVFDPAKIDIRSVTLVVMVDGKVRDHVEIDPAADEAAIRAIALENEKVRRYLDGREPARVVVKPPKLVNVVL